MLDPDLPLDMLDAVVSPVKLVLAPLLEPRVTPLATPRPRPVPLVTLEPRVPRVVDVADTSLWRSSSSAFRRASSRRLSASSRLRSASCCLCSASLSMSTKSWVAPFQEGFSSSRWLCSVCDTILVQVFKRVLALFTVCATVCCAISVIARCRYPGIGIC